MVRAVIVSDMLRGFFEEGYQLCCGIETRSILPIEKRGRVPGITPNPKLKRLM